MSLSNTLFIIILLAAMFAAYKARKLTLTGALTGGLVAAAIYLGAAFTGIALLAAFFIMATFATSWKKSVKQKFTTDSYHPEIRNAGQVLANGGIAALCGMIALAIPKESVLFSILMAAALASATADTLSSELGTVYGRRFYHIITLKTDEKGRDGVISLEGTLIGVAGSAVIALIYSFSAGWSSFFTILFAGTAGNLCDSVLGATLERKGIIKNNAVNFLNTLFAAIVAYLMLLI